MLINLEGIDGCGKSTQSQFLMDKFENDNEKTIMLKEPTNGKYGQKLWNMLSGKIEATTEEILELFVLDRKEHVNQKIKPALDQGKIVLMDRYYYSTMAYQSAAGIDVSRIRRDNEFAPKPDIVLIFDLPADLAMKRVRSHSVADVFEKEEHLEKVRKAYLNLENDPLVRIIDATGTPEEIFDEVWRLVSEVRNG
ncbi:MAG: dTMP kinase [Marine Group III euryarchaeote CG-Epi4]|uniref:Probable thymidylate kinase n=1 Tax=Marine Group III euryarchaeote CG-Epi4 TaxID=1888998 RepID=A0A1J5TME8_9ARCH|nr:MAG: dTMP kinase [Marine Group III euryarchaeote CG-Epi4]|tara:strand:+ start:2166 stop:2750 length:585 start_codon:yes stop_codon:yes gene_type:complete